MNMLMLLLTDVSVAKCPAGGAAGARTTVACHSVLDRGTSLVTVTVLTSCYTQII